MAYPVLMAGRIEEGYRLKLRALLARVRPRRLEFGVELCLRRARELAEREGIGPAESLARVYEFTRWRVQRRLEVTGDCDASGSPPASLRPRHFLCDGSTGGVARWLRAAGYQAAWRAGAPGASVVAEAAGQGALLVTTDHRLLERAAPAVILSDPVVGMERRIWPDPSGDRERRSRPQDDRVVWVPSGMDPPAQAGVVLRDLGLPPLAPRCMACGGALEAVAKEAVRDRIPPRTALWKDEYFACAGCGQLFWQGTHWARIRARLERERPAPTDPGRP